MSELKASIMTEPNFNICTKPLIISLSYDIIRFPESKPHLAVHLVDAVVHELHGVGVREELVSYNDKFMEMLLR